MSKFLEKFCQETDGKYDYIKLSSATVYVRKKMIELTMLYPENVTLTDDDRACIEQAAVNALASNATVTVRFAKSYFDAEFVQKDLIAFFDAYPFVCATMQAGDIVIDAGEQKRVSVRLEQAAYDYCIERGVPKALQKHLDLHYCDHILCEFSVRAVNEADECIEATAPPPALTLENPGGRFITPSEVELFIGKKIDEKASYIADALFVRDSLTVCGTLTRVSSFNFAKKDGKEGTGWRLTLDDETGIMECVHFPSDKNKDKFELLSVGAQLLVRGSLAAGKKEGTLSYKLSDISFCKLPTEFVQNRIIRPVDTHYRTIQPEPYRVAEQVSLFDLAQQPAVPAALRGKTVVVFDLETTGTNPSLDAIIEIGAVKIVDGVLTETFGTLIDPARPIPEGASKVNGITDQMVAGMPSIADALPDFYKFCDGASLAAHNIQFDASFAAAAGKPLGIYFDHEKFDTLQLARKYMPGLRAYNLGFLCEHLSIDLTNAHRAVADAVATAQLLIHLFSQM